MTVGLADAERIFYSAAAGVGNPVVYAGSKTGRDGIHGATMASAEFDADSEAKRPTVQVGDPFTEKLLMEACLELMETDAIVAIQDMGAAGLTCSSVEMASKGGTGIELDLERVPLRETGMTPYEIMLSESQERMLMVLKPGREAAAHAVFDKWGIDFAVVGHLTDSGRLILRQGNRLVADLPISPLVDSAPLYERPWNPTPAREPVDAQAVPAVGPIDALTRLLASPDLCCKRWVWEQYDHMVMADTLQRPGGDAAVVRVHGTNKGLALTTDCTPRYCAADPRQGGAQAVAEAWRNLTACGAQPLALTDCLNFGNPERPDVMGQFVGCIEGMREACRALDFPVVSGNVSFYNETDGHGILPAPTIGGVGLIADIDHMMTPALKQAGDDLILIGRSDGHLGASLYLREIGGSEAGPPPPVDLEAERANGDLVRRMIEEGRVSACHDISDGGLLVAVAEMALASLTDDGAGIGATLSPPADGPPPLAWLFGEDQGRYLLAARPESTKAILAEAERAGVPAAVIGVSGGSALKLAAADAISLSELFRLHESWLPDYMSGSR